MNWIFDLIGGILGPFLGPILAGVGGLIALWFAKREGKKEAIKEGTIVIQQETIDAHQDRERVESRVASADDAERDRLRKKWSRD